MHRASRAFTLVELLVVVAIIALLVSLLLPAVQAARETGRQAVCQNNLKQLALGSTQHFEQQGWFPTGGWGYGWIGDPDRGYTAKQPGGWVYNILSYIDEDALRQTGAGSSASQKPTYMGQVFGTPLALLICPARRHVQGYPVAEVTQFISGETQCAKTDYAANAGDQMPPSYGPSSLQEGDTTYAWPAWGTTQTGIAYMRSRVTAAQVKDGFSNVIMLGEKNLNPDNYWNGQDSADNDTCYQGHDWDVLRWIDPQHTPLPDIPGLSGWAFGSAHAGGAYFVFCDGGVHLLRYNIDPNTYCNLGGIADGLPINGNLLQ